MKRRLFMKQSGFAAAASVVCSKTSAMGMRRCPALCMGELPLHMLKEKFAKQGHLEAYARFSRGRGKGTVAIRCPEGPLLPGMQIQRVELVYTAAQEGIAPGGKVVLSVPPGPAESAVQIDNPAAPAYMEVKTASAHPVSVTLDYPPFEVQEKVLVRKSLVAATLPQGLPPGETVTFIWHDVKLDNHARRWNGDSWRFPVLADHDADGWAEEIQQLAELPKRSGPAESLLVRCASMVLPGEPVRITVSAFDRFFNPASEYTGTVSFTLEGGQSAAGLPPPCAFTVKDRGSRTLEARFDRPGFYWIIAMDTEGRTARSNPIEVLEKEPAQRLYWGDLHVHTEMSADARVWAHTTSTYEGSYQIGRFRYGLDFMANTDHHGLLQGNYSPDEWETMKRITNRANLPGQFITLVANEYSHPQGDANAYFKGGDIPYFDHEPYAAPDFPEKLFAQLKEYECVLPPHHFAQNMRPYNWANYDAALMPICEIFSNHGRGEFFGNHPHYSGKRVPTIEGQTWVDQLLAGKKMGCMASSDDHWARPGTCGLTGAWSPSLTRDGIYNALAERRCYATTGDRTILYFTVDGAEGGRIVPAVPNPEIRIRAASGSLIQKIEIVKDGETVYTAEPGALTAQLSWRDPAPASSCWYYVRLTLEPQAVTEEYMRNRPQFVWSAPVWLEQEGC